MVSWPRVMPLLGAGRRDELLGQGGGLAGGDHPADRVPGVDVQDHIQVVVRPFRRAVQLGDVPRIDLVRPVGRQLRLDGSGMCGLRTPFPALAASADQPPDGPAVRRAGQRAGVPGPAPLDHVAGVRAFPAQHRALLADRRPRHTRPPRPACNAR